MVIRFISLSFIDHFSVTSFPLDMTTGRNLGYCFVRFDTVADLIKAYNKVYNDSYSYYI